MSLSRSQLRDHFKAQRHAITADARTENNACVCTHLDAYIESLGLAADAMVGAFMATADEVDLRAWRESHLLRGGRIALPRVNSRTNAPHHMTFHRCLANTSLAPNRYGILEPVPSSPVVAAEALQIVLVPLVAYDLNGSRLGMGGGYYDRYLVGLMQTAATVGIAFACQASTELLPIESWDMPLQAVVTENGVLEFA